MTDQIAEPGEAAGGSGFERYDCTDTDNRAALDGAAAAARRALDAGVKLHGATVHFVVPEVDSGPIIVQGAVPVHDDDSEAALAARVLGVEHRIYPLALRLVAEGRVTVAGNRCRIAAAPAPDTALLVPGDRT